VYFQVLLFFSTFVFFVVYCWQIRRLYPALFNLKKNVCYTIEAGK
jgi:hypothetical protein